MASELSPGNNIVRLSNKPEKHYVEFGDNKLTIFGKVDDAEYEKTFKVGDLAEYDSDWNGSLYGKLKRIYPDKVLVVDKSVIFQLSLYEFARRNWNFDLNRIHNGLV